MRRFKNGDSSVLCKTLGDALLVKGNLGALVEEAGFLHNIRGNGGARLKNLREQVIPGGTCGIDFFRIGFRTGDGLQACKDKFRDKDLCGKRFIVHGREVGSIYPVEPLGI